MASSISSRRSDNPTQSNSLTKFQHSDPSNPRNWSETRKWTIVAAITLIDLTVSWGASGYSPAMAKFIKEFNVSSQVGTLGLSLYVFGLALGPMTLAPLSEYYGRTPLYLIPYGCFLLFLLGTALAKNLACFLVLRFFSGLCSSVTVANFGGTIADLWPRDQVGPAMSVFLWAAVGGSSSGYFLMSFVAQTRGWRDVFWALLGVCGGFWLILVVVLLGYNNETRHSILLRRRAKRQTNSGDEDLPEELQPRGLGQLFKVTLSRPFRFLNTEAIIIFAALYNGFLYGLSFLFNGAFNLVFGQKGYGFDTLHVGLCFLGIFIGVSIGPITNIWQEKFYQKRIRAGMSEDDATQALLGGKEDAFRNIPEARLQIGKVAAVALPISLWWFAWTCVPSYHVHWIVPLLATSLFGWSFYTLILMSYVVVEDSYSTFSASALAGVALIRNLAGAGFPLFGSQLFENLGFNWGGTIVAVFSMLLVPIPFVLEKYGPRLRAKSPWARQHMDDDDREEIADSG